MTAMNEQTIEYITDFCGFSLLVIVGFLYLIRYFNSRKSRALNEAFERHRDLK